MKLLREFEAHQHIFNQGYRFNPEDEVFFTKDITSFTLPEGYKEWAVKEIDCNEYLANRLQELGIDSTPGTELYDKDGAKFYSPIFIANQHGDIEILQYSIRRVIHTYEKKTTSAGTTWEYCVQRRLNPNITPYTEGKYDFTEAKNTPFWHPRLIEAFEAGEPIETLVITEGQFKAFKATEEGIFTVGLTSISHFKEKATGQLHTEIIEFIHQCNVQNVVILWDADCKNISSSHLQEGLELTKRPGMFYGFASSIKKSLHKLFSPKKLKVYFATIKDEIESQPKGIDDLLCEKNIKSSDVCLDFQRIGQIPGYYIDWININDGAGEKSMRAYFKLNYVGDFYKHHSAIIKEKTFVFYGTTYRIDKGHPVVEVDKNLKKYMRIGPDYFRLVSEGTYNNEGEKVREDDTLTPWKAAEITRDFGKDALSNVVRLDGFCNIPNNVNYKQIVDNKWNLYSDVRHDATAGDWKTIEGFIRHIFGDQYEMGLDYLQILYSKPYQKLPVLSLVSKEEGTGKSTFLKLLYMMFQNNMTFVTPDDILGQWSSHWVSKLVVASEETFFEKKEALEKIKNISTADKIMRSERFVNNNLIDCFVKFVFCSNHEDDFIKLHTGASRFWIIKVKQASTKDTDLVTKMQDEIGHFIHFLQHREIVHPRVDRMWFSPDQYKTEAFFNIVKHSEPGIIKDLRLQLEDYFLKYGVPELHVCVKDLKAHFGCNGNDFYLNKILMEYFRVEKVHAPSTYNFFIDNAQDLTKPHIVKGKGRFLIFKAVDFIKEAEKPKVIDNQKSIFDEINKNQNG